MFLLAIGNILCRAAEIKPINLNEELTFFNPTFNLLYSTFDLYGILLLSSVFLRAEASNILIKYSALIVML